jgi:hypothetical protein
MWDYVDVQMQHNRTFLRQIPPGFVNRARVLANFHDGNAFSDPKPDGIGNGTCRIPAGFTPVHVGFVPVPVATRVMLPSIFSALTRIANQTDPLKLAINGISYKPFISLFNLTEAAKANPDIAGIGALKSELPRTLCRPFILLENYNSLAALELRNSSSGEPTLRLKFKNGTDEHEFRTLTMFGKTDVPLSEFISRLTVCGDFTALDSAYFLHSLLR